VPGNDDLRGERHARLVSLAENTGAPGVIAAAVGAVLPWTTDRPSVFFGSIALVVLGGALLVMAAVFGAAAVTVRRDEVPVRDGRA
jgi:hypothetical protein